MSTIQHILKTARKEKGLRLREVANALAIDQSLISKFENGTRKPSKVQLQQLSTLLGVPFKDLMVAFLSERIIEEYGQEEYAIEAMSLAESTIKYQSKQNKKVVPPAFKEILKEIDYLKKKLDKLRAYDSYRISQALELEYTFESNRIEGNTLTLQETDLVINEGLTISGKSMREHLEAINHQEAISYIKSLVDTHSEIHERDILGIHRIILRGIDSKYAGVYRNVQVLIKGSSHTPPPPYLVNKQMEDFFIWFQTHKHKLHPVAFAAEAHERLVSIHPFIDGNGRTSRLLMNLILLKNGYVIANLKGDPQSRLKYYKALELAQNRQQKESFIQLIAETELEALNRYLSILS